MATATDQIKESLIGTVVEPSLSTDAQATFERHAKKDGSDGELYMTEADFVDAIAPGNEDFVGHSPAYYQGFADLEILRSIRLGENNTVYFFRLPTGGKQAE